MILVGELSLWLALLMGVWSVTTSFTGGWLRRDDLIQSGEGGLYASAGFVGLASLGLWAALLTSDFSLRYVASFTSEDLPLLYKLSAFWGGPAGSMLLWCLLLAILAALATWTNRNANRALMPWVTGTSAAVLLFFVAATAFAANPFERLGFILPDGLGLNPELQHPAMAIHPPLLFLGYVASAIIFSFTVAALVTRRLDASWLRAVRTWSLVSWVCLTVGILLGMWWAYAELGSGGYWMWDPVENASLLPWLTGTALLHSIMIQEKRGMLRTWNVVLVVATFLLSILGTILARSGVIQSMGSFQQSAIGPWFVWFLALVLGVSIWLVSIRLKDLGSKAELESMLSREAALLSNNLVLVGIALSVLWGMLYPLVSGWVLGTKRTLGESFFNAVNVPLGLLLLALMGIGPLIAWRRAPAANVRRQLALPAFLGLFTGAVLFILGVRELSPLVAWSLCGFVSGTILQEFYVGVSARMRMHGEHIAVAFARLVARNRQRYGGYIVHAGIVILFAAFAGMAFKQEHVVTLVDGQTFTAQDPFGREWRFTSDGLSRFGALDRDITVVAIHPVMDGKAMPLLTSEIRQTFDSRGNPSSQASTEAGILRTMRQDVYLVLARTSGDRAELRVSFNPLVMWVWQGGILMALGGLFVLLPRLGGAVGGAAYGADPAEELIALAKSRATSCPTCGAELRSERARFCGECGAPLAA